ncbi:MAG: TlyA family RNA methyltransferase [Clostridia bacterium]|nr:TlyA family RNA methyltransferase [Clostridia bacterium]
MKTRLDTYLAQNGLTESREKAKALIIAGEVAVNGVTVTSPSTPVAEGSDISIKNPPPFVSRGGLKLEKAVGSFGLDLEGSICADLGASTGGFTDCMLQHGARHVYAVDVGYGQLAYKLRQDPRVTVMERTNARYLDSLDQPVDFVGTDVSFISLLQILPAACRISTEDGRFVGLIKPQFEAGREKVGRRGVVRDPAVHAEVIRKVADGARDLGLVMTDLTFSPITGPNGNIEFPALFERKGTPLDEDAISAVVGSAHAELGV